MLEMGAQLTVTISHNPDTGIGKFKVIVDPSTCIHAQSQMFALKMLEMLETTCSTHNVADKGHKHSPASGGKSEVHFITPQRHGSMHVAKTVSFTARTVTVAHNSGEYQHNSGTNGANATGPADGDTSMCVPGSGAFVSLAHMPARASGSITSSEDAPAAWEEELDDWNEANGRTNGDDDLQSNSDRATWEIELDERETLHPGQDDEESQQESEYVPAPWELTADYLRWEEEVWDNRSDHDDYAQDDPT